MEIPDMKAPPKQLSNNNDVKELKEFSVLNMAVYLFRRQDNFLTAFQAWHDYAMTNADYTGAILINCLSKLKHAALPTKYALLEKDRRILEKKLDEIARKIRDSINGRSMTPEEYTEIHGMLYDAADFLYEANQLANMGVPRDIRTSAEDRIRKAIR